MSTHIPPNFCLLETMLFEANKGIYLITEHLIRLRESRNYFFEKYNQTIFKEYPSDDFILEKIWEAINIEIFTNTQNMRIRLVVDFASNIKVTVTKEEKMNTEIKAVVLDSVPISSENDFLRHKTTNRDIYNLARSRNGVNLEEYEAPFDVILFNEKGQLTETSIANIAIETQAASSYWITPQLDCGLLAGTKRAEILKNDPRVQEGVVTCDQLKAAVKSGCKIKCFNSVRGEYFVRVKNV